MDVLRQQLNRISEQLSALSASQKMLTASLLAIMVMTLLWWARYAAVPELVPVLDRSIASSDMSLMKATLAGAGIDARIVNDRMMVPAERQLEALAVLGYANRLPSDSADAWDTIVKNSSPFDTAHKTSAMMNAAKQRMLSQLIQRYFPDVTSASVVIEPTMERKIGGSGDLQPSASVFIEARPNSDTKRLAKAAASMVATAQAGLSVGRVSVSINGRTFRPSDPSAEGLADGEMYETIRSQEQYYEGKIRDAIPHLPNAHVTVSVDLDLSSSQETRRSFDPQNTVQKETLSEVETSETVAQAPAAAREPGAQANVAADINDGVPAAGGANSTMTEKTRTQMEVRFGESLEHIRKPGGKPTVVGAAVRVPRSYFVQQYRQQNPSAGDPDDAALLPLVEAELEQVKKLVVASCALRNEEAVTVGTYFDTVPMMAVATGETSVVGTAMGGLFGGHVKEIAVGSLALLSLFMVMMMVRRSSPVATISPPIELQEVAPLATDEHVAGEVGEGSAMLDGMELDEDTIKAQQMVEQVSTMVKENPDAAADLVKRWLNRT